MASEDGIVVIGSCQGMASLGVKQGSGCREAEGVQILTDTRPVKSLDLLFKPVLARPAGLS